MHRGGTAREIARWTALGALFLIPFAPLLVANSFFFPFITGKAFFFRILVEVAVAAWVVLALIDKEYRPRFSWVGAVVLAFVLWMGIADAFALNATKAFWSNFERMEGWVLLAHLLGFFLAMSSVLRVEKKWRGWFLTSLAVSVIVSFHALLQLSGSAAIHQGSTRIDASFGNSAYLAIYFLFNVFIALWLAFTEKQAWLKWSLILLSFVEGILLFFTETRGAVLGLAAALLLTAFLAMLTSGKKARLAAGCAFVGILILIGGFYLARDSAFVQENHTLQRVSSISLADGKTRFTIWGMAYQGVLERPVVGWGQEGFNYVFNKYYEPSLYTQEQWFDRAHNAFIDWFSAGGFIAFALFLSLFGSAFILLWRSSELSRPERIALTGALVGYAIHNLFVFDNLYSYIYFFAILALIDSQVGRPLERLSSLGEMRDDEAVTYALPIAAVAAIGLIWFVNIPGMRVASKLITAVSPSPNLSVNMAAFEELVAEPAFASQEIREQLVSLAGMVAQSSLPNEQKMQVSSLAITEMRKQVDAYPLDARERLQLSYAYRAAGDYESAVKEARGALELSPKKEQMWLEVGSLEWDRGNAAGAKESFDAAYALGPEFKNLAAYAAVGRIAVGDYASADAILMKAFGTTIVDNNALAVAYYRTQNWPRLIGIWKMRAETPGSDMQSWFSLAAVYYASGDRGSAIQTINRAVELYPEAASSAAAAIKQIEEGALVP